MKHTHRNLEDPFWTAYVLDEVSGEERREAEALLAEDSELRAGVERLRETVALTREALAQPVSGAEGMPEACRRAAKGNGGKPRLWLWLPTAAAALVAIGLGGVHLWTWDTHRRGVAEEAPMRERAEVMVGEDMAAPAALAPRRDQDGMREVEPEVRRMLSLEAEEADAPEPGRFRMRRSADGSLAEGRPPMEARPDAAPAGERPSVGFSLSDGFDDTVAEEGEPVPEAERVDGFIVSGMVRGFEGMEARPTPTPTPTPVPEEE